MHMEQRCTRFSQRSDCRGQRPTEYAKRFPDQSLLQRPGPWAHKMSRQPGKIETVRYQAMADQKRPPIAQPECLLVNEGFRQRQQVPPKHQHAVHGALVRYRRQRQVAGYFVDLHGNSPDAGLVARAVAALDQRAERSPHNWWRELPEPAFHPARPADVFSGQELRRVPFDRKIIRTSIGVEIARHRTACASGRGRERG